MASQTIVGFMKIVSIELLINRENKQNGFVHDQSKAATNENETERD